jgi:hypothetical protein
VRRRADAAALHPPAQANLGLRRLQQAGDFLTLASWQALKEPGAISAAMHCQLARLHGQLYSAQGRPQEALKVGGAGRPGCALLPWMPRWPRSPAAHRRAALTAWSP